MLGSSNTSSSTRFRCPHPRSFALQVLRTPPLPFHPLYLPARLGGSRQLLLLRAASLFLSRIDGEVRVLLLEPTFDPPSSIDFVPLCLSPCLLVDSQHTALPRSAPTFTTSRSDRFLAFSPPSYLPPCSLAHDYLTLQSIHTRPFSTRESTAAERPRTTTCIAGGCAAARRGLMSRSVSEKSVIELAIRVMTHCDCAFCLGNVVVVSPPLPLSSTISLTSS